MQDHNHDSTRILRLAAWIWIGYLIAMAALDFILYAPGSFPVNNPTQPPLLQNPLPILPRFRLMPVVEYYAANGSLALFFLGVVHWDWIQKQLGRALYPLLLIAISAAPIIINVFVVPRFPNGPLANSEGMALRQLPVLILGLALVAWQYKLPHVLLYSIATTSLELGLIFAVKIRDQGVIVLAFVAIIRTISFIALGIFIGLIVAWLREQQESLRQANANLTHYASTLEQLTVSRERNRLARELHDTLAHSLSALSVQLETVKAYWEVEPEIARQLLDQALSATRSGLNETRRALKALRASPLDDLGLLLALRKLAQSAAERGKLHLQTSLPEQIPALSAGVEQCIYRVAQEAIENTLHHASAKNLEVRLTVDAAKIDLLVADDGVGMDAAQMEQNGHFGLAGMRERAQLVGGVLEVDSQPQGGTRLELTLDGPRNGD